ncbi:MFS transporter [Haloplanus halobius]|uniref:MFS transporter n=1 Tax=Haloplanus halobius TaxID=2934938 RepID=UPI00200E2532
MSDRWLYAWGLASVGLGGASLVVPLYVVALGGGPVTLGVLAAAAAFAGVPGALGVGWLADRTGHRRRYILAAIGAVAVSLAVVPAVESIPVVVAVNAVLWFAFAAALPVLTLLVVVDTPESAWSDRIARLNRIQGIGWALGLLVGFCVVLAGEVAAIPSIAAQRVVCLVCAASAGGGGVVALRSLPADADSETGPGPNRLRRAIRGASRFGVRGASFPFTPRAVDPRRLHPRRFVRRFTPDLALFFVAIALVFAGFGAFFAPLPAYLAAVGFGDQAVFGLYLVLNVGAAAFFGVSARLTARYETMLVHVGALAVRGVAIPAVVVTGGALAPAALVFAAIGCAWAVIAVTAGTLVTRLSPAVVRGEALGVYSALSAAAGGVGSIAGGWLAARAYLRAFGVAGGLVLVGAGVVALLRWRVRRRAADDPERSLYSLDSTE